VYRFAAVFFTCFTLLLFPGCDSDSGNTVTPPDSFRAVVVGSGTISNDGTDYPYQLLRLEFDGKEPSYAQWFPHPDGKDAPAVMLTDPYGQITWNGDVLPEGADERTPEAVFLDANIYLINGFSALNVFGRYYAGGDIRNEVDDMVAGLRFLAQAPRVMRDRIAVYGGSWGGFESVYASAHAPEGAVPRVGVALYPVSDFQEFMHYLTVDIPLIENEEKRNQYINFFAPFVERINAGTGGDYSRWTRAYLLSRLRTPYLVLHDQWDTLIPYQHSKDLADQSAGMVRGIWFLKGSAADLNALPYGYGHGDLQLKDGGGTQYSMPMYLTLSLAYLLKELALPEQIIINGYDPDALDDFVAYLKTYKDGAEYDMEWAAPRLLDLADARVYLVNMDDPDDVITGAEAVAGAINAAWGTSLTMDTVRGALANGLPPYE